MKISSRFSKAVHILSLLSTAKDAHCTSEWIAGSVGTNPVIIRKILGQLKKAGLADVVEEGELFRLHEQPNPDCPVGANIQAVLELIVRRPKTPWKRSWLT